MYDYVEFCTWFIVFIILFICTHYQFKWCIPVSLWVLKFIYTCWLVVLLKIYVMYRVNQQSINWDEIYITVKESLQKFNYTQ